MNYQPTRKNLYHGQSPFAAAGNILFCNQGSETLRRKLTETANRIKGYILMGEIFELLEESDIEIDNVTLYHDDISIIISDAKSYKDAFPILQLLSKLGFPRDKDYETVVDKSSGTIRWRHYDPKSGFPIRINLYLATEFHCEAVKTGEKTITHDVYEYNCQPGVFPEEVAT